MMSLLYQYEGTLVGLGYKAQQHGNPISSRELLEHARWMIQEMLSHLEKWPDRKLNRWLGFVQGILNITAVYSISQLRNQTRPLYPDWKHFKGGLYTFLGFGRNTETKEPVAVYHPKGEPSNILVRPARMWLEEVTWPDGVTRGRFVAANEV